MKITLKVIAVPLLIAVAVIHLLNTGYADWHRGADSAYVVLLFVLFATREAPEDERVRELKLKALTVGFAAGYAATFAVKLLRYWQEVGGGAMGRSLSAFDFMFVALVVAHLSFRYWRWQDGRAAPDSNQ